MAETITRPGQFRFRHFAGLLFILLAVCFWDVLLGLKSFYFRDYGLFGLPNAFYHRECFWRGELPLWNPFNNSGVPFLAQWNTLTLYPGSLIYLLAPLPWSLNFFLLVHLYGAGLAMFWLVWRWTGSSVAASVSGIGYAFNGLALNCLMWPNNMAAWAWIPLVLSTVPPACATGGRKAIVLAALAGTGQMLTGAPEIIVLTWVVAGALVILGPLKSAGGRVFHFLLVVSLVAGLSAVQLRPFLDLLKDSERSANFADGSWSMPGAGWINFILPLFDTVRSPSGVHFQEEQAWTSSYYTGIILLMLAVMGFLARDNRGRLLAALGLFGSLLALGPAGYLYQALITILPGAGFVRFPVKFVVLPVFVAPIIAGLIVSEILSSPDRAALLRRVRFLGGVFLLMLIGSLVVVTQWRLGPESGRLLWQNGLLRAAFLAGGLVLIGKLTADRFWPAIGLCVVLWADVVTHVPWQNPTARGDVFAPNLVTLKPQPALGESRAFVTPTALNQLRRRMLSNPEKDYLCHRLGLHNNCNLLEHIAKVDGFYSLSLREEAELRTAIYTADNPESMPLLEFLGVSQISAPMNPLDWLERTNRMPLLSGGQAVQFADPGGTFAAVTADSFRPRKEVFLPLGSKQWIKVGEGAVKIAAPARSAHELTAQVEAVAPSIVVLAETFDRSWEALVDGRPVAIWRANHAFQAVQIPAGKHQVVFRYGKGRFWKGAFLTMAAAVVSGLVLWKEARLNDRPASSR